MSWRRIAAGAALLALALAGGGYAAVRVPRSKVATVYCVEPDGQVDSQWMLDRSTSIACPDGDFVYISAKPRRFEILP